jgi:hypothetical protein
MNEATDVLASPVASPDPMAKLSPAMRKFLYLEGQKAQLDEFYDKLAEATAELAAEIGVGGAFRDHQGIVYKIVEPKGKFVYFEKLSYVRTKRPNEVKGSLSVKEAESLPNVKGC